jgi:hypothetical protein
MVVSLRGLSMVIKWSMVHIHAGCIGCVEHMQIVNYCS